MYISLNHPSVHPSCIGFLSVRYCLCKSALVLTLIDPSKAKHVLLRCPKTMETRNAKLLKLDKIITVPPRSLGAFLNGPGRKHPHYLKIQRDISEFCHAIHLARLKLMESSSGGGRPGGRVGMVGSGGGYIYNSHSSTIVGFS